MRTLTRILDRVVANLEDFGRVADAFVWRACS